MWKYLNMMRMNSALKRIKIYRFAHTPTDNRSSRICIKAETMYWTLENGAIRTNQKTEKLMKTNKQSKRRDGFRSFRFNSIRLNYVNEIIVCKTEFLPIFHCINDCSYMCVRRVVYIYFLNWNKAHLYTHIYIHFIPTTACWTFNHNEAQ